MTPVSHTNYSPKYKIRLSVSLNQLGLRSDKGVVRTEERRRVGKEERSRGEEVKKRRGELERRGGKKERSKGEEVKRRGGELERRQRGEERWRREGNGEEKVKRKGGELERRRGREL